MAVSEVYEVKYKFPRKYNGAVQTARFRTGYDGFWIWLTERSPTIQIISHGYKKVKK